jgi:hypothetical protein
MIYESSYWKDELLRQSKRLRAQCQQKRWREASSAKLELTLMSGFYIVRKLVEAKKLSQKLISKNFQVTEFPPSGKAVNLHNRHDIDRLFKLDEPNKTSIDFLSLCNQFVHSYVFVLCFSDIKKLTGIFVASDWMRTSRLYYVEIEHAIKLFDEVGGDYPTETHFIWDKKKQDYKVTNN